METTDTNNPTIVEGYFKLLTNLNVQNKLDLISKLSMSIQSDLSHKKNSIKDSFGAFESEESAEEIIAEIRNSRTSTRQIEEF